MKRLLAVFAVVAFTLFAFASPTQVSAQTYSSGAFADSLCSAVTAGFPVNCAPAVGDKSFSAAVTTSLTQVIAAPASGSIHITAVQYAALESATGGALEIEYGTGTNCGTGTTVLAGLAWLVATTAVQGSYGTGKGSVFILPSGKALCLGITAGTVTFAQVAGTYAVY